MVRIFNVGTHLFFVMCWQIRCLDKQNSLWCDPGLTNKGKWSSLSAVSTRINKRVTHRINCYRAALFTKTLVTINIWYTTVFNIAWKSWASNWRWQYVAETTKESLKTKTESGNCFCIRVVWSIKLRSIDMFTNLEYRARGRQRKRESRRQATEAQREKGRKRSRAREKNKGDIFFVGRATWKFCSGGDKMRNASGHQCKVKMSGSEKKWTGTRTTFPL